MTTESLSAVAKDVVHQYHAAGKQLVRAYRAGTARAVGAVNAGFAATLNARPLPLVTESVKGSLIETQQQVAGVVSFGLGLGANGADIAIDQVAMRVANGIDRLAHTGARVDGALGVAAMDKVGGFALPVAQASLGLAQAVAQGSKRLSDRVAGEAAAPAVKKAARKPASRKTAARKPAAKAAAKPRTARTARTTRA